MICLCFAFQYYGILMQPLTWSDSWICMGVSSFWGLKFVETIFGKSTAEYLSLRFRDATFFIEDLISGVSTDQGNRSTIMNNRPLALGNGAVFLSNSPFMTPLLFVKSPIVISIISQQCGENYFSRFLSSIVLMCYKRLDDQKVLYQDIVGLLPLAKILSNTKDMFSMSSLRHHSMNWIDGSVINKTSPAIHFPEPSAKRLHVDSSLEFDSSGLRMDPSQSSEGLAPPLSLNSGNRVHFQPEVNILGEEVFALYVADL